MPTVSTTKESLSQALAEQLTVKEFIKVVMDALDIIAEAEIDELLIASIWNKLKPCYDESDLSSITLDSLVKEHLK